MLNRPSDDLQPAVPRLDPWGVQNRSKRTHGRYARNPPDHYARNPLCPTVDRHCAGSHCRPEDLLAFPRPASLLKKNLIPDPTNDKGHPRVALIEDVRRRPTLPRSHPRSTIGAEGLSFRVRNGAGRFTFAMTAETLWRYLSSPQMRRPDRFSGATQWTRSLVSETSPRPISTGQLHTLPCFHVRPINPVFCWGPYQVIPVGILILERVSRLDAFSGYPFRT